MAWSVLVLVLAFVASGRFPMELAALGGLLLLGIAGTAPPDIVFSGFGHPALATIVAVFLVSQGIVDSGLLHGLGQALARRIKSINGQVISIAWVSAVLSAFMNNVGAVGLMLPTAVRMAGRSSSPGSFGLPLAVASIMGGTLTLIGSAPNIIIASYMLSASGESFKMFDFTPHGAAMLLTAFLVWWFCKACGMDPGAGGSTERGHKYQEESAGQGSLDEVITFAPLATRKRQATFLAVFLAVLLVSLGLLHPALSFGKAAMILIIFRVLKLSEAYKSVDLKIVFFLGSMLGIGQILEHTGGLDLLSSFLSTVAAGLSPFWLVLLLVFASSALSNAINNAAAAVFMAPLAAGMAAGNSLETAAALMAVAAGSNMTLLLPTHQAALMVLSRAPFPTTSFVRTGLILSPCCGLVAAGTITLVWQ